MPKWVYCSAVVLILFAAVPGPAQVPNPYSTPPGYDGTDQDSVLKAGREAAERGESLTARVFYERLRVLDSWGNNVDDLMNHIREAADKEEAALSPAQRSAYEEFRAHVIMPEILVRLPGLRRGMDALLKAGDEEAAGGYAETITQILPHDAGALAAMKARLEASPRNAKRAYEAGDVVTAAALLARAGAAAPDKSIAGRVQKALKAHKRLQDAMNGDSGREVSAAAKALSAVCARDSLLNAAKAWKTRPAGMASIPAGTYLMGCTSGDGDCQLVETPAHRVSVKAFFMDSLEVTAGAFAECVEAGKCTPPLSSKDVPYCTWGDPDLADHIRALIINQNTDNMRQSRCHTPARNTRIS